MHLLTAPLIAFVCVSVHAGVLLSDIIALSNESSADTIGLIDFRRCECLYELTEEVKRMQTKYDTIEVIPCVQVSTSLHHVWTWNVKIHPDDC